MDRLVQSSNNDVRQVLNSLQMWSRDKKVAAAGEARTGAEGVTKSQAQRSVDLNAEGVSSRYVGMWGGLRGHVGGGLNVEVGVNEGGVQLRGQVRGSCRVEVARLA